MTTYDVRGFYIFGGTRGTYAGELTIDRDGIVKGVIIDDNSESPERDIEGRIVRLAKPTNWAALTFLKKSRDKNLADILYDVRGVRLDSWNGTYNGTWRAVPRTELIRHTGSFELASGEIAHTGIFEKLIPHHTGKEQAELTLARVR